MDRRPVHTKILATLGPATASVEVIARLIEAGADAFRLNFSHAQPDLLSAAVEIVRSASRSAGVHIALLGDLCGPKVRIGKLRAAQEGRIVQPGDELVIVRGLAEGGDGRVGTNEERMIDETQLGHRVLIDDGALRFVVSEKHKNELVCRCTVGGPLYSRKGVNLPDTKLSLPALTDSDRAWVAWSAKNQLDYLALSFVRRMADVEELRGLLREARCEAGIVSKIEHPTALDELEAIIDASDAVMIARGDLGVEMDVERVPLIQKDIIRRCSLAQKPVIVATQMLQSMVDAQRPTRAEVSDVANAIYDGADAVMLSGETAVGKYPALAVETMNRIADVTERHLFSTPVESPDAPPRNPGEAQEMALAQGACRMARSLGVRAIVTLSRGGGMAKLFAKLRPPIPVLALGQDDRVLRRAALFFGVTAYTCPIPDAIEGLFTLLDTLLAEKMSLTSGDAVLIVGGLAAGKPKRPNAVMIHRVGACGV